MIILKYRINGALFRRRYERDDYQSARARVSVLRQNEIAVLVRGMPKRIQVSKEAA
jgi:hypothetical protein